MICRRSSDSPSSRPSGVARRGSTPRRIAPRWTRSALRNHRPLYLLWSRGQVAARHRGGGKVRGSGNQAAAKSRSAAARSGPPPGQLGPRPPPQRLSGRGDRPRRQPGGNPRGADAWHNSVRNPPVVTVTCCTQASLELCSKFPQTTRNVKRRARAETARHRALMHGNQPGPGEKQWPM